MRINFKHFLWAPLSMMLIGFPVVSKAGTLTGSPAVFNAKSSSGSIILVDDHRGGRHDRGRWNDGRWNNGWRGRDRDRDHERWEHRRRYRDWDDYYGRSYYYYPYSNGYYPYYGYNYYEPYGYPYGYPYYGRRGNTIIGGFLRLW